VNTSFGEGSDRAMEIPSRRPEEPSGSIEVIRFWGNAARMLRRLITAKSNEAVV
jgi:hypothetical protein